MSDQQHDQKLRQLKLWQGVLVALSVALAVIAVYITYEVYYGAFAH